MSTKPAAAADIEAALRQRFEAWVESYGQDVRRFDRPMIAGIYQNPATQGLWAAYRRGAMQILESLA